MDKLPKDPHKKIDYYLAHPEKMLRTLEGSLVRGKQSARAIGVKKGDLRAITMGVVELLRAHTSDPVFLAHLRTMRGVCKKAPHREAACKLYADRKEDMTFCDPVMTAILKIENPPAGLAAALAFARSNIVFKAFCPE